MPCVRHPLANPRNMARDGFTAKKTLLRVDTAGCCTPAMSEKEYGMGSLSTCRLTLPPILTVSAGGCAEPRVYGPHRRAGRDRL